MDRDEAIKLLEGGPKNIDEWNRRREAGEGIPDLSDTDLMYADLDGANLSSANLTSANLTTCNLISADLSRARVGQANLSDVDLKSANLSGANLAGANLSRAYLHLADVNGANLGGANLGGAQLGAANFSEVQCGHTLFAEVDLSRVKGLDSVQHSGPSTIGIDTLYRSGGKIPEAFLRGCGVPEYLIENQKALIGSTEPIQFYSCFISYSTNDEQFAKRLHSKMRDEGLRVWFAPEDMQSGKKLHEQVDEAIRVFDKLLLILSPASINSKWVRDEIRRARKSEIREGRRKLFPIRLMDYQGLEQWKSFYADLAEDLAEEIREYFIPDFSNWKDHDSFEAAFARVLKDLKAEESAGLEAPIPGASRRERPH